ncbi:tetratricopeptide repeat protein [Methylopila sp. M107]|uniref:tetratricopeptide repeat protein n=1 Tax=Methylopila sp. M107 TaxID=1101190 RepID=UPI00037D243D|nr:tetratricopeptide repeat protein [Methylopila sp. M107]
MVTWLQRFFGRGNPEDEPSEEEQETDEIDALMDMAFKAAQRGDYQTAIGVWRPLAKEKWPRAMSNLGACYAEGLGVPRNIDKAARLFSSASEAGDSVGRRNLATLYFKGEGGVEQDDQRAAELFELAAGQGDAAAQDMLSWMMLEGQGVEYDPTEAREWALAAAEQGVATSMTRLGLIAHNALGMDRDAEEAARWWYEAARRGEADGQAMLGAALHLGAGVEQDDRAAMIWLLRAEQGGSALAAAFMATVREALSPAQLKTATDAARKRLPPLDDGR